MTAQKREQEMEARRGGWICFTLGSLIGGLSGWAFTGQPLIGLGIGLGLGTVFGLGIYFRDRPRQGGPYEGYLDE